MDQDINRRNRLGFGLTPKFTTCSLMQMSLTDRSCGLPCGAHLGPHKSCGRWGTKWSRFDLSSVCKILTPLDHFDFYFRLSWPVRLDFLWLEFILNIENANYFDLVALFYNKLWLYLIMGFFINQPIPNYLYVAFILCKVRLILRNRNRSRLSTSCTISNLTYHQPLLPLDSSKNNS